MAAFRPLQEGIRSIVAGHSLEEAEADVQRTACNKGGNDFVQAAVTLTLKCLRAVYSHDQPGELFEEIVELLGTDVLGIVIVD